MISKLTLYGSGATALLVLGVWLGRRSARKAEGGLAAEFMNLEVGKGAGVGISQLDYGLTMPKLAAYAGRQATKAQAGSWLTDYRKAENLSSFYGAPVYNAQAYFSAGYWMAVAARLLRSRTLGARAAALVAKGSAMYYLPGSSFFTGSVVEIMAEARETIARAGKDNAQVKAIVAIMGSAGDPKMVAAADQRAADKSWVTRGAGKNLDDAGGVLSNVGGGLRRLVGAKDPNGQEYPAWQKWAVRGALAGLVFLGGFAYWKFSGVSARLAASALQVRQKVAAQIAGPVARAGAAT